jgi:hypothetical protein
MKKLFITGIFLVIVSLEIYASEQDPDLLVYNGKEYEIGVYPMETYFKVHPDKRPENTVTNSALDRGYRAKYEIINNELILIDIEIWISDIDIEAQRFNFYWQSVLEKYFGNRIKMNTFTGNIYLFNGEETGVYRGFTPIYEYYKILEIENGNFIKGYDQDCYEYLQLLIQSSQNGSYEQNFLKKILVELNKIKK